MTASDLLLASFAAWPVLAGVGFVVARRRHAAGGGVAPLVAGNVCLFACLAGFVVFGGEVYYRFLYDSTDAYQVGLVSSRWVARHYRTNNIGVRDDIDYERKRTPGVRRFTFLGDSFTNGHGIPDVRDRYVNRLRAARPDWEIHSLAEDGLDTGPILARLESLVRSGYELDVVVYAYGMNDVTDLVPEVAQAVQALYAERPNFVIRHSFLFNTWYYRLRIGRDPGLRRYFDWVAASYGGARWRRQEARLTQLRDLVERHGGRLVVVTFPFLEKLDDPQWRAIQAELDDLWQRLGVPQLDLADTFAEEPAERWIVNRWDTHPNERAQARAALAIETFLAAELEQLLPGRNGARAVGGEREVAGE